MARLDVRLDDEQRRRLDEIVEERGRPLSEVVRGLIDDAYEAVMRERRLEAVQRLVALEVEEPPDPAQLSRELEVAHEPGGLHSPDLALVFESGASPIMGLILGNLQESRTIATQHDALLLELVSGEVVMPSIEIVLS